MSEPTPPESSAPAEPAEAPQLLGSEDVSLDFRSGGYALLVAFLLVAGVVAWRVQAIRSANRAAPSHEPRLEPCLVERETLVRAAERHGIPRLSQPRLVSREEAQTLKLGRRGKFLVSGDLVIGVGEGEAACAFPLRFLQWHEAIAHDLAGTPIVVCWSPLSGSAAAFERAPRGEDGQAHAPLSFVASGYLHDSGSLLVDEHEDPAQESLWSPLLARAVTGPAAAAKLTLQRVPLEVLRWEDWQRLQPQTRVLAHDPKRIKLYKREPYRSYEGSDTLRFPVTPAPPAEGPGPKDPVLAVEVGGAWRVYPLPWLEARADAEGYVSVQQGERALRLRVWRNAPELPPAARVVEPSGLLSLRAYWFAWHAARPADATLGISAP